MDTLINITYSKNSNIIKNEDNLKIFYINIRSLRNEQKFDNFVNYLNNLKIDFDIIAISETWFREDKCEQLYANIEGYYSFHSCRITNTYGGGVSIYIKENIKSNLIKNISNDYLNLIVIKLLNSKTNLTIGYRQPKYENFNDFINVLDDLLENTLNHIVIGDFNINLLDTTNINTVYYHNLIKSNGFHILNKISSEMSTRNISSTIIDHVFTDLVDKKFKINIQDCSLSDHNALLISSDFNITDNKESQMEKSNINYLNLMKDLNDINFNEILIIFLIFIIY